MAESWRTIHLGDKGLPQLLVKTNLHSSGYSIILTDLSRVWGETLVKRGIERRAIKEDCSIDPGDGEDQYKILCDKLEQALSQSDGTTLSLRSAPSGKDGLILSLTAPLPSPLPDFKWDIHFSALPAQHVEAELVTPLLHQAQNLQTQVQQLIHELRDKDRVISKLSDKLETTGSDLTAVFPGANNAKINRKKPQRGQLARYVQGLADFNEKAWAERHEVSNGVGKVEDGALARVLRGLPPSAVMETEESEGQEWWRDLAEGVGVSGRSTPARKGDLTNGDSTSQPHDSLQDGRDDEFQRQGTPPHLRKHLSPEPEQDNETQRIPSSLTQERAPPPIVVDDESTTEDEDDLDAPPRKAASSQRSGSTARARQRTETPNTSASTPRKAAAVSGRQRQPSPSKSSSPARERSAERTESPSPPKPRSRLGAIGGKKQASVTPEPTPEAATSPVKPRAKLGAIGGKNKASETPDSAPTSSATDDATPASPAKPHRLGMLGGKKGSKDTAAPASIPRVSPAHEDGVREASPRRSRQPEKKKEATPPPWETSEERANRKRGELKRQLEEKAKAPVKKKRKF